MNDPFVLKLDKLIPGLEQLEGAVTLKVGVMEGAQNPETGELVAEYAFDNEYGNRGKNIPPRPALRYTLEDHEDEYVALLCRLLGEGGEPEAAMETLGLTIQGDMIQRISHWKGPFPRNSAATVERKGFDQPLVETGAYQNSIEYVVGKDKGAENV